LDWYKILLKRQQVSAIGGIIKRQDKKIPSFSMRKTAKSRILELNVGFMFCARRSKAKPFKNSSRRTALSDKT
jgi:hypothetical protein